MKKKSDGQIKFGDQAKVSGDVFVGDKQNISISGKAKIRDIKIAQKNNEDIDLTDIFQKLYSIVEDKVEGPEKQIAVSAIQGIENEAKLGNDADEEKITRWFTFLKETSIDAFDVALQTFKNPILGVSSVIQKVVQKINDRKNQRK